MWCVIAAMAGRLPRWDGRRNGGGPHDSVQPRNWWCGVNGRCAHGWRSERHGIRRTRGGVSTESGRMSKHWRGLACQCRKCSSGAMCLACAQMCGPAKFRRACDEAELHRLCLASHGTSLTRHPHARQVLLQCGGMQTPSACRSHAARRRRCCTGTPSWH